MDENGFCEMLMTYEGISGMVRRYSYKEILDSAANIIRCDEKEVFIDCGGFSGDTVNRILCYFYPVQGHREALLIQAGMTAEGIILK